MPGLEEIVNGEGELVKMLKEKEQRKCKDLFDELLAQLCCTMMDQHKRQQLQQQCQEESTNNSANAPLSIIVPPAMPNWDLFPSPISPSSSPSSAFSSSSFSTGSPAASPNFLQFSSPLSKTLQSMVKKVPAAAIKTTVDDPQRPHKCEHCGKAFRFKSNLFEHKSLHYPPAGMANGIGGEGGGNGKSANGGNSRQPFVCPFCAKTCRLKGNLKKHLQVHVNSPDDLERLWKRSFSRQSGRPRKNAPHRPLPKPGDDLGLVPLPPLSSASSSSSSADHPHFTFSNSSPSIGLLQWAFPDQLEIDEAALC